MREMRAATTMRGLLILLAAVAGVAYMNNLSILVNEEVTTPGVAYHVEGWGEISASSSSDLICTYFNGRRLVRKVYWYGNGSFGSRDSCANVIRN
jgi:hypothetical protein